MVIEPELYTWVATSGAPNWWPNKQPQTTRAFALDVSAFANCDDIDFVSASVAPSGTGEMCVSDLLVDDDTLILTCAGGVPTRIYTIKFLICLVDGETIELLVHQGIPPGLRGHRVPVAPSPTFGPAITWPTLIGWAGFPIFGRPSRPSKPTEYAIKPALLGGF